MGRRRGSNWARPGTRRWDKELERRGMLNYQRDAAGLPRVGDMRQGFQQDQAPSNPLSDLSSSNWDIQTQMPPGFAGVTGSVGAGATGSAASAPKIITPKLPKQLYQGEGFKIYDKPIYEVGYWQDPKNVSEWYTRLKANPGARLPDGVTADQVDQAYQWFKFRNNDTDPSRWAHLPADDPMLSSLGGMPTPDPSLIAPSQRGQYRYGGAGAAVNAAGAAMSVTGSTTDWRDPNFEWKALTIEQKQAIIRNPQFNVNDVAAPGQMGLVASDPAYDLLGKVQRGETQWWNAAGFFSLSNPETSQYVQLGALVLTSLLMKNPGPAAWGLGGFIAAKASEAEDPFVRDVGMGVGQGLQWSADKIEQAAGMAQFVVKRKQDQWAQLVAAPAGQRIETLQKIIESEGGFAGVDDPLQGVWAAETGGDVESLSPIGREAYFNWLASKVYYETVGAAPSTLWAVEQNVIKAYGLKPLPEDAVRVINSILPLYKPEGSVWRIGENKPVAVLPGFTPEDAVRHLMEGASPDQVIADWQRVYGYDGVLTDLGWKVVADPLNVVDVGIGKTRAEMRLDTAIRIEEGRPAVDRGTVSPQEYLAADRAQPVPTVLTREQSARAVIERLHAKASFERPTITGELLPWSETSKAFRDLVRTRYDRANITTPELVQAMSKREQWVAQLMPDGALREYQPGKPGFINFVRNLLPEKKAILSAHLAGENLAVLMDFVANNENVGKNLYAALVKAGAGDMRSLRDMGLAFMDNPEFYTVQGAIKDFIAIMEKETAAWETTRPNRELFHKVAAALGEGNGAETMLAKLTGDNPGAEFARILDVARSRAGMPEADWFVASVEAGKLTPDLLKTALAVFTENGYYLAPREFKSLVLAKFYEHMGKWGVDHFEVKKAGTVDEVLRGMKGAQSLMLLDMSPSYFLNNFFNNRVLMAAGGSFGFTPDHVRDAFMSNFPGMVSRYSEGFGPTGEGVVKNVGTAEQVVQAATRGTGPATKVADAVSAVRQKVGLGTKLSVSVESSSSKQMYYDTMRSFWGRNWKAGTGFDRMPAVLENTLRSQGIDPEIVYRNLEGYMRPDQLETLVTRASSRTVHTYVNDVAERFGMRPEEVSEMLAQVGVLDELNDKISKAGTPDDVVRAITSVEGKAEDSLTMRAATEIRNNAEHFANKVKTEGYAGAHNLLMDLDVAWHQRWLDHYTSAGELADFAAMIDDPVVRNNAYRNWRAEEQKSWDRHYAFEAATWKGLWEGLGVDDVRKQRFLAGIAQYADANRAFTARRDAAYDQHFADMDAGKFATRDASVGAFKALEAQFEGETKSLERYKAKVWKQLDELTVEIYREAFGPGIEKSTRAWVDERRAFHDSMVKRKEEFRASLQGLTASERKLRKALFYRNEYPRMISDFIRNNQSNEARIYSGITGEATQGTLDQAVSRGRGPKPPGGEGGTPEGGVPAGPPTGPAPTVPPSPGAQALDQVFDERPDIYGPRPEADKLTADHLAKEAETAALDMTTIAGIASEHGLPLALENGEVNPANLVHAWRAVRKWGGDEGQALVRPTDLMQADPELVRRAFDARQVQIDSQLKLDLEIHPPEPAVPAPLESSITAVADTLAGAVPEMDPAVRQWIDETNIFLRDNTLDGVQSRQGALYEPYKAALEARIKAEAFRRVRNMAAGDRTIAEALRLPFDWESEFFRLDEIEAAVKGIEESWSDLGLEPRLDELEVMRGDMGILEEMLDTSPNIPEAIVMRWVDANSRLVDLMEPAQHRADIEAMSARAETDIRRVEARGEAEMTREIMREKLTTVSKLTPEQVDARMAIEDAWAAVWAKEHDASPEDWYRMARADLVSGGEDLPTLWQGNTDSLIKRAEKANIDFAYELGQPIEFLYHLSTLRPDQVEQAFLLLNDNMQERRGFIQNLRRANDEFALDFEERIRAEQPDALGPEPIESIEGPQYRDVLDEGYPMFRGQTTTLPREITPERPTLGMLYQQGRLEPMTGTRMDARQMADYASALVRDEATARSAVLNEINPRDRVALLDALHKLDPEMAERIAHKAADMKMLYQESPGPIWYSQLQRTVESIPMESMTVEQLRGFVGGKVKAGEMKWGGMDDFLATHKGKVTKAETLDYLRQNQVELREITKTDVFEHSDLISHRDRIESEATRRLQAAGFALDEASNITSLIRTGQDENLPRAQEAGAALGDLWNELYDAERDILDVSRHENTKYASHVLPGGENYREVLLTLPEIPGGRYNVYGGSGIKLADFGTRAEAEADVQTRPGAVYVGESPNWNAGNYTSPHWQEPNVLAHVRLDDRVDVDGKRVLFVEEVQSDWHQAGREQGYIAEGKRRDYSLTQVGPELYEANIEGRVSRWSGTEESVRAQINEGLERNPLVRNSLGVSDAPFSKTWHELTMKRVLRMAAEEGYDRVAWTTGAQQAARYDLSKQVDAIEYSRHADGTIDIDATKGESSLYTGRNMTVEEVRATVGKEIAAKIVAAEYPISMSGDIIGRVTGTDLQVGGAGMRTFYDKMIPEWADKYAKKWGAKTGETRVATLEPEMKTSRHPVQLENGRWTLASDDPFVRTAHAGDFATETEALARYNEASNYTYGTVHSLDVTPEMRASVLEGQPLFQGKKGGTRWLDNGKAIEHAFAAADFSTSAHEFLHVARRHLNEADLAILEAEGGVKDGNWTRENEEWSARAFERYLTEGKAPTPKLEPVFAKIKRWMLDIYQQITGSDIDVPITDAVRGVFDRMLGAERAAEPALQAPDIANITPERGAAQEVGQRVVPPVTAPRNLVGPDGPRPTLLDQVDTGTVGGLLPGMQDATGMMFDVQPGSGRLTPGEAPGAHTRTDVQPGRTALDKHGNKIEPADIVIDDQGGRHGVTGVSFEGKVVTQEGQLLDPKQVRRTASQSTLFQDGGEVPLYPPGGFDQSTGYGSMSRLLEEGWTTKVRPILDAMKESAQKPETAYSFGGFDDATQKMMNQWLGDVRGQMATMKHVTSRWAETNRDYGLLNYQKQYGADKIFGSGVPYGFWATHSGANWLVRGMDHPQWFATYAKLNNAHNTWQNQLPERLRDKIFIPMPWMPKWAGGGMWIDPSNQIFPWQQYAQPLEAYSRDQNGLATSADYILHRWAEDGTVDQAAAQTAFTTRTGPEWQRAMTEAQLQQQGEGNTGFDYFSMLASPALYITIPYYLATHKTAGGWGWPSSQLPVTRTGSSLETAFKGTSLQWLGDGASLLAKPERWVRQKLGLNEFGEFGDYYIDRQAANMTIEGYDPKAVNTAMIERSGPIYDEALKRVRFELMLRTPSMAPLYAVAHGATLDKVVMALLPSLFPGGILSPGELAFKGLKNEYNLAWAARKDGDNDALNKFFEAHPEYESRLALKTFKPEDRIERQKQFLRSSIWDAYEELGATNRKQATAVLGPSFQDFLGSEPGVEFSLDQLVKWARLLNQYAPKTPESQAVPAPAAPLPIYGPETTKITDGYFSERSQRFPNFYALEQGYYAVPPSERPAYLARFPQHKAYQDWRASQYEQYPELKKILNSQAFATIDTAKWPPILEGMVSTAALTGDRLSPGARAMLEQVWIREGKPRDNFNSWLTGVVYPAMLNKMNWGMAP